MEDDGGEGGGGGGTEVSISLNLCSVFSGNMDLKKYIIARLFLSRICANITKQILFIMRIRLTYKLKI